MSDINTINLINQMRTMAAQATGTGTEASSAGMPFNIVFQQALNQVNDLNQTADSMKTRFELGDPNVSLGEVMIAGQKANLGFEASLRVRNELVRAYKAIMDMPI